MTEQTLEEQVGLPNFTRDGKIPFDIPSIDHECSTYYKIFGDLKCGTTPLVILHGGAGAGHEYLLTFAALWPRYGIPVIFYDQIGCGQSTHLRQTAGDKTFWQMSLFIKELNNLIDFFDLRKEPGFSILGQSWGGMLGPSFASTQPAGLQRLILASGLASRELSVLGNLINRKTLPQDVQDTLCKGERENACDSAEYKAASAFYWKRFMCTVDPTPLLFTIAAKTTVEDPTVQKTL